MRANTKIPNRRFATGFTMTYLPMKFEQLEMSSSQARIANPPATWCQDSGVPVRGGSRRGCGRPGGVGVLSWIATTEKPCHPFTSTLPRETSRTRF